MLNWGTTFITLKILPLISGPGWSLTTVTSPSTSLSLWELSPHCSLLEEADNLYVNYRKVSIMEPVFRINKVLCNCIKTIVFVADRSYPIATGFEANQPPLITSLRSLWGHLLLGEVEHSLGPEHDPWYISIVHT